MDRSTQQTGSSRRKPAPLSPTKGAPRIPSPESARPGLWTSHEKTVESGMTTTTLRTRWKQNSQCDKFGARTTTSESIRWPTSRGTRKNFRNRQTRTHVPNTRGENARFRWIGAYWIVNAENDTFELGTLAGEILWQKVNGFRLKPYSRPKPLNQFENPVKLKIKDVGPLPTESSSSDGPISH